MSTIKLSDLPHLTQLDANSSNSLFVVIDIPDGANGTKIITGHDLALGLYANESLNVGSDLVVHGNAGIGTISPVSKLHIIGTTTSNTFTSTVTPGTAPFTINSNTPVANLVADTVVTNANLTGQVVSVGNVTTITNANVINKVLTGYIISSGTISATDTIVGAIAKLDGNDVINLKKATDFANSMNTFLQSNIATGISSAISYTDAANTSLRANDYFVLALALSHTDEANSFLQTTFNNSLISANTWLKSNIAAGVSISKSYTDGANNFLQSNDFTTLSTSISYTDAANTWLQSNISNALSTARSYTDTANTWLRANDFVTLNTSINYTNAANTFLQANDYVTLNTSINYTKAANTFLQANDYVTLNTSINYTNAANTFLQANDYATLNTSINYTNAANAAIQTIAFNSSKAYTDAMISSLNSLAYNWVFADAPATSAKSYTDTANAYSIAYSVAYTNSVINYPITNVFYVDPARTDSYTATGSLNKPFKTVSAALTYIHAGIDGSTITPAETNPIFIVLKGSTTESVTLTRGHIFLVGEKGNKFTNISVNGTITVSGANNSSSAIDNNYFVISGLSINAGVNNTCIQTTGSNAQSLFLKDVSVYASGTGTGVYANNTGFRSSDNKPSFIRGDDIRVSHTGTGDVYCFNINKGNAKFTLVETDVASQIAAVQNGASLTFVDSQLEANGTTCLESYGTGSITVKNSSITNYQTSANAYGVWLHNSGSTATLEGCNFAVIDIVNNGSRAVKGVSGSVLNYTGLIFEKNGSANTNNLLDSAVTYNLLTNSFTRV